VLTRVKYADAGLQPDGRARYPIDTPEHAAASWSSINEEHNAARYSPRHLQAVRSRIRSALRRLEPARSQLTEGAGSMLLRAANLFDRAYPLDDIQILRSGDGRTVEAYAAVFGSPYEVQDQHGHYMEVIERAAFDRTLKSGAGRNAMCLYNHGMTVHGTADGLLSVPIGNPLEIKPDGRGLLTVTRYNKSDLADSVLESIRNGEIKSQSFRGRIVRSSPERLPTRNRTGRLPTITRHELGLTDYGPTPIPVNAGAEIMAVRSLTELRQDFAALDDDDRLELLRTLGIDPDGDDVEEYEEDASDEDDDTPTSDESELGAEDPPAAAGHSGRLELQRAALRAELILKGVRRAQAA
jgi:HK97 family phage prohead protease